METKPPERKMPRLETPIRLPHPVPGWAIYAIGWAVWLGAMWLPAIAPSWHGATPLSTARGCAVFVFGFLGNALDLGIWQGTRPQFVLLIASRAVGGLAYVGGVLASALAWSMRGRRHLLMVSRLASTGLLLSWWGVWFALSQAVQDGRPPYPGFIIIAPASTLICIGVWLIPPRHGRGGIAAELTSRPAGPIGHRLRRWLREL